MNPVKLSQLASRWERFRLAHDLIGALARGLVAGALVVGWSASGGVAALAGVTLIVAWTRRRRWRISPAAIAAHLDRTFVTLEESASLWLRAPAGLTLVEQLQRQRLDAAWRALVAADPNAGSPPKGRLRSSLGWMVLALGLFVAAERWMPPAAEDNRLASAAASLPRGDPTERAPTLLQSARIEIEPPAYMQRGPREIAGLDGEAEAGAVLRWTIQTTEDVAALALTAGAEAEPAVQLEAVTPGRFLGQLRLDQTLIYQLVGLRTDGSRWTPPDLHAVKAVPDQVPRLAFSSPILSRTALDPANPQFEIRVMATDDFGIGEVHLVATVAKGSGEGVKFRDLVLPLSEQTVAGVSSWTRTLDTSEFALEPGDEIYFHAVASDQRAPQPQTARTETRFAVMPGVESSVTDPGVSVARVNLIPEYFRSQRQLIMDTQRLVAARPILPPDVFARHSDAIGVDQKLLRLRYGQFLGEEFEPEVSGAPAEPGTVDEHGHPTAGAVALPGSGGGADTGEKPRLRPEAVDRLQEAFMHNHDKPEAATFFGETVKASLRQVLAAMWEAEGFLRTARPAEALPAENRALELLKTLQQADRVYVKRMGFEPPVIRLDERRLRGELDAIPATAATVPVANEGQPADEALRSLLAGLSRGGLPAEADPARDALVESRLLTAAQADPDRWLGAMGAWRTPPDLRTPEERRVLSQALWSLLPEPPARPRRRGEDRAALSAAFADSLRQLPEGAP